jgi:hypothetical protein
MHTQFSESFFVSLAPQQENERTIGGQQDIDDLLHRLDNNYKRKELAIGVCKEQK